MIGIGTLNILLAVAWAALTGNITLSGLLIGYLLGMAALFFTRSLFPGSDPYFRRIWRWFKLILVFLYELVVSSIQVVWDVVTPRQSSKPAVISFPLDMEGEMGVLLIANLISLTPGTLSLDVTDDRQTLYIHAMFAHDPDELRAQIKGSLEKRAIEAME